ncbi:MAG TPA: hypothetical protein VD867_16040 [Burkholderiales bacterium]|nr:hypothetical protein [Burkholderiales bacterium]
MAPSLASLKCVLGCAAIAMLASGCATRNWTKPGADAAAVSRDLDNCRAASLGSAPIAPSGSSQAVTERGRPGASQPTAGSNERFVEEHEATSRCMSKRGYELR